MRAAKYKRISSDREGRELGVLRQDDDLDKLADRLGATVSPNHDYTDNDISASTRSKKPRPEYQRMLAAARNGEFDVVLAYTSGRLTRRPRENEDLIELAREHGTRFQYVASPSFDLNTAAGRRIARIMADNDTGEAEDIAERVERDVKRRAEQGAFHGGIPAFGYQRIGDTFDTEPEEKARLLDAARRVLRGESLYAITDEWNAQGWRTRRGNFWRGQTLRAALLTPSVIGLRVYKGQEFTAPWPAIMERPQWDRLHELLTFNPSRLFRPVSGTYEGKRAFNGIAFCSCDKRLYGQRPTGGRVRMICHKQATGGCGKVAVAYDPLEEFVLDMIFARLDSPEFQRALIQRRSVVPDNGEDRLREELRLLDQRRTGVGQSLEIGAYTKGEAVQRLAEIDAERQEITRQLSSLAREHVLDGVSSSEDARQLWATADVTRQRRFLGSFIGKMTITPFPAGQCKSLPRRRGESDEALAGRRSAHDREMMRQRVSIEWLR